MQISAFRSLAANLTHSPPPAALLLLLLLLLCRMADDGTTDPSAHDDDGGILDLDALIKARRTAGKGKAHSAKGKGEEELKVLSPEQELASLPLPELLRQHLLAIPSGAGKTDTLTVRWMHVCVCVVLFVCPNLLLFRLSRWLHLHLPSVCLSRTLSSNAISTRARACVCVCVRVCVRVCVYVCTWVRVCVCV